MTDLYSPNEIKDVQILLFMYICYSTFQFVPLVCMKSYRMVFFCAMGPLISTVGCLDFYMLFMIRSCVIADIVLAGNDFNPY